jgi:hypothetical protein
MAATPPARADRHAGGNESRISPLAEALSILVGIGREGYCAVLSCLALQAKNGARKACHFLL